MEQGILLEIETYIQSFRGAGAAAGSGIYKEGEFTR